MSETREDIQAQIDQLDHEWDEETLSYKKTSAMGRMPKPVSKLSWFCAFILLPLLIISTLFIGQSWASVSLDDRISIGLALLVLPTVGWQISERKHKYAGYSQALSDYESKRAELQAQLDALD